MKSPIFTINLLQKSKKGNFVSGNSSQANLEIKVPHDKGKK